MSSKPDSCALLRRRNNPPTIAEAIIGGLVSWGQRILLVLLPALDADIIKRHRAKGCDKRSC